MANGIGEAPVNKPAQRAPATLADAMGATTLADAVAGRTVGWGETLTGHVMTHCGGCGHMARLSAAGLVADGVPPTTPILEAGKRLRCSACGSKAVTTWPKLRMSKRVDARN